MVSRMCMVNAITVLIEHCVMNSVTHDAQAVDHVSKGEMFVNGDRTVVKCLSGLKSQNSCDDTTFS